MNKLSTVIQWCYLGPAGHAVSDRVADHLYLAGGAVCGHQPAVRWMVVGHHRLDLTQR